MLYILCYELINIFISYILLFLKINSDRNNIVLSFSSKTSRKWKSVVGSFSKKSFSERKEELNFADRGSVVGNCKSEG